MFLMFSTLTMVVTDGGEPRPLPGDGAVPLGWAVQRVAFLAGEALRSTHLEPLLPGPNITVVQLELSWTQNVWKVEEQLKFYLGGRSCCWAWNSQDATSARGLGHQSAAGWPHGWPIPIGPTEPGADRVGVLARCAVVGQHAALQPSLHTKHVDLNWATPRFPVKGCFVCFAFLILFQALTGSNIVRPVSCCRW